MPAKKTLATKKKTFQKSVRQKVLFTDPHVHFHAGNDIFVDISLEVIEEIRDLAFTKKIDAICLGDVFDLKDSVDGVILCRTWDVFEKFKGINNYFLYGNHDLILTEDSQYNLLAAFRKSINVVMPYQKVVEDEFCFHFMSYYHDPMTFMENNIELDKTKKNILFCHQEINGYWFNNQRRAASILTREWLKDFGFDYVISGHLHKRQVDDFVAYIGSTHQMSWKDKGVDMGYTIMDLDQFGSSKFLQHHKFRAKTPTYVEVSLTDVPKVLPGIKNAFVKVILSEQEQKEWSDSRLSTISKQYGRDNYGIYFNFPKSKDLREDVVEDDNLSATDVIVEATPEAILEDFLRKLPSTEEKVEDLMDYVAKL